MGAGYGYVDAGCAFAASEILRHVVIESSHQLSLEKDSCSHIRRADPDIPGQFLTCSQPLVLSQFLASQEHFLPYKGPLLGLGEEVQDALVQGPSSSLSVKQRTLNSLPLGPELL